MVATQSVMLAVRFPRFKGRLSNGLFLGVEMQQRHPLDLQGYDRNILF